MQITKKIIHHGVWVILAIIIGILIVFLLAKGGNTVYSFADSKINELKQNLVKKDILKDQISPPQASKKTEPPLDYFAKDPDKSLEVSALVYLVGDLETGEIILSKNINETFPIASVSKLMTASLSDKDNELLYPLLLKSSNSTAEKIARNEGRDNFIIKMRPPLVFLIPPLKTRVVYLVLTFLLPLIYLNLPVISEKTKTIYLK